MSLGPLRLVARVAALGAVTGLGLGCWQHVFNCSTDAQCASGVEGGRCEVTGYCSFVDPHCSSGRRYASYASSQSNQCVGDSDDSGSLFDAGCDPTTPGSVDNGFGSFSAGRWPSACWRPYAETSPLNLPIGGSPTLNPAAAPALAKLLDAGPPAMIFGLADTPADYKIPTYYASASAPRFNVHCIGACAGLEGQALRVPQLARAGRGSRQFVVVDQVSGWEWDFLDPSPLPDGGGTLSCSDVHRTSVRGDGVDAGGGPSGLGYLAGVIRVQELSSGRIDHALSIGVPCVSGTPSPPASRNAPTVCSRPTDGLATGAHLQLVLSDEEIADAGFAPWKAAVLRAFAHYGAYVTLTQTSASPIVIQVESDSTYSSFGGDPLMQQFGDSVGWSSSSSYRYFPIADAVDWKRLRVLAPP